jgi:hypothetical protein
MKELTASIAAGAVLFARVAAPAAADAATTSGASPQTAPPTTSRCGARA